MQKKPAGKLKNNNDDVEPDENGFIVEATMNRNKQHQFQKHFNLLPKDVRKMYEEFSNNNPRKAYLVVRIV